MSARRSKRLCSTTVKVSASEDTDVPALKRRRAALESEANTKTVKSTSTQKNGSTVDSLAKVESNELEFGKNSRRSARAAKSTKSSYFESPVASEGSSAEDDQTFRSIQCDRKSNTRASKAQSKIAESSEESEEYDSEDEVPKPTRKRKPNTSAKNSTAKKRVSSSKPKVDDSSEDESAGSQLMSNQNRRQTQIKGFESESDSSSDDDSKAARKPEPNRSSFITDPLESDDETTADVKPIEFFDFSALVSQMSQANNEEEKEEKPNTKQTVVETPEPAPTTSAKKKKSQGKKPAVTKKDVVVKTEKLEVFELLAMGEKTDMSAKDIEESVSKAQNEYEIPRQVEIVFDTPLLKKKKKCDDLEMALRRRLNNIRRENQVYIHKTHVLCWIAHGIHLNRLLNSADLLACALSLIPNEHFYPAGRMKMDYLEKLIKYFTTKVKVTNDPVEKEPKDLLVSLQTQFEKKEANSKRDLCFMFICIIRAMGIKCRLIINLNVAPLKPNSDQLLPVVQKKEGEPSSSASTSAKLMESEKKVQQVAKSSKTENKAEKGEKTQKSTSKEKQKIPEKEEKTSKSVGKQKSADKEEKTRPSSRIARSKSEADGKKPDTDDKNSSKKSKTKANDKKIEMIKESGVDDKNVRRSSRISTSKSKYFTEEVSDDEEDEKPKSKSGQRSVKKREASDGEVDKKPKPKPGQRSTKKQIVSKTRKSDPNNSLVEEMSTSDSEDSANEFRTPKKKISRKVLSTDEEKESVDEKSEAKSNKKPVKKTNHWLEVFLEEEEKWSSVDIGNKKFLCDEELSKSASAPIRYVLAFNSDQTIKDVTRRYAQQFLSVTRKLRADEEWWTRTMAPFKSRSTPREREEDEELEKKLEDQPKPKTISELKNHPLYALRRHLLKFQAIYPEDAVPVYFIKTKDGSEPVYRRACVHQLHGREMWIKEAKVVKLNEKPYKIVKGRQKKDKFGTGEGPRDLELFGLWQTEDYDPPVAENGKVPRNAFGNVELFKMSMLPKGTVYLQIPGLQRIANKLSIDCVAAITGFEYSTNGWSYPVKEGFVVCEEFKDVLLDAYNQEVEEAERKEKQKREERIYSNWKRLIRAMFIAEKLKRKYNFGEPSSSSKTKTEASASASANPEAKKKSKK